MTTDFNTWAIDAWAQPLIPGGFDSFPEIRRLFEQSSTADLREKGMDLDEMIAMMDRGGVEKLMLCAWHRPGKWIITNDQVADIVP